MYISYFDYGLITLISVVTWRLGQWAYYVLGCFILSCLAKRTVSKQNSLVNSRTNEVWSLLVDFVTDYRNALALRAPRWSISSSIMTKITLLSPTSFCSTAGCFVAIHRLTISCHLTIRSAECLAPQLEICIDSFERYIYLPKYVLCGIDINNFEVCVKFHCNSQWATSFMWLSNRKTGQMY